MQLRAEFETAWKSGAGHDSLLELVRRHQQQGMATEQAYRTLHQLWLDSGFDDSDATSALQDNLEYVLEKLWFEQPAAN